MGICCCVGSKGGVAREDTAEITGREEGNTPGNLAYKDKEIEGLTNAKGHLVGGVTLKACERAIEVAGRCAPTRELLYHIKVVLLHLVFHLVRTVLKI